MEESRLSCLFSKACDFFASKYIYILVFSVFCFASLSYVINANRGVYADDDNMWFYSLTYKILDPAGFEEIENGLIRDFKEDQASENMIGRLVDKQNYTYNYFFSSVFWIAGRHIVGTVAPDLSYPDYVSHSIVYGFALAFFVTLGLFLFILLKAKIPLTYWRALAWFAAFSAIATVLMTPKPAQFMIMNMHLQYMLANIVWFFTDPSFSFGLFSFTGRNNYVLLFLAFVLVRWRGHYGAFYILCALSITMHASMAMLAMLIFIAIDALVRPEIFKKKSVIASIVLGLAYYFLVETLWQKVGFLALGLFVPLLLLICFGVFQDKILSYFPKAVPLIQNVRARANANVMGADIFLFLAAWIATFFPVMALSQIVDPDQFIYFWSQLHMRILAIFQPVLLFAFFYWIVSGGSEDKKILLRDFAALLLAGFVFMASFAYLKTSNQIDFYPVKMRATVQMFDDVVSGKTPIDKAGYKLPADCYFPEGLVWYLAIKDYHLKQGDLEKYLSAKPKGKRLDCTQARL